MIALTTLRVAQFGCIDVDLLSSVHGYGRCWHSRQEQHSEPGTEESACGAAGPCWSVMSVQEFAATLGACEMK